MDDNKYRKPATVRREGEEPASQDIDWQAVYDEQQADGNDGKDPFLDNQAAKIGCGCFVPIIAVMSSCSSQSAYQAASQAQLQGYIIGGVIFGLGIAWLPFVLFWLRKQSRWLWGLSFVVIAAIFAITNLATVGRGAQKIQDDFSIIKDVTIDKDGNTILNPDAKAKGPFGEMMLDMMQKRDALFGKFESELLTLGTDKLFDATALARDKSPLRNCAAMNAMKPKIKDYHQEARTLLLDMRKRIETMDYDSTSKQTMLKSLDDSLDNNLALIDRQWEIHEQMVGNFNRACVVLARARWSTENGAFVFTNAADMREYNTILTAEQKLEGEYERMIKNHGQRMMDAKDRASKYLKP